MEKRAGFIGQIHGENSGVRAVFVITETDSASERV
jgi:hypothetical protein